MIRTLVAIALFAPAGALAQARPSRVQPVTQINLDAEEYGGVHRSPGGVVVDVRDPVTHESLLKLRTDFAERVLASSAELH